MILVLVTLISSRTVLVLFFTFPGVILLISISISSATASYVISFLGKPLLLRSMMVKPNPDSSVDCRMMLFNIINMEQCMLTFFIHITIISNSIVNK